MVDLEDGTARLREKGLKRVLKIGFFLGWLLSNLGSYYLLGRGADFIVPTGFSTNRLMFVTFLLYFLLIRFKTEKVVDWDRSFDWGYVFIEERDGGKVEKKW